MKAADNFFDKHRWLCCKHFIEPHLPFRWTDSGCELLFEPGHGL